MHLHAHRYYAGKQTPEQILAADKSCAWDLEAPAPDTYMQQVGSLDLAPLWKKIDAPVLIVYGTADFITDAYQHRYLRDMIDAFHPGRAAYRPWCKLHGRSRVPKPERRGRCRRGVARYDWRTATAVTP